ncbi:MmcQ/YjbR family DNA-binding protein [Micromonospora sp. NPDC093277]|uniref:MmcQ/YjbR family DNA-binding protein n=1 Tax=Micromonospora sp. NPDC093277 TaxID=3364291 RepID=UPI0038126E00
MATWDDVRRIALALPETTERGSYHDLPAWRVRDKSFVWDRPLRPADLTALGDSAPDGPVLGARVPDLGAKEALLADDPEVYFTIPHLDGYPAVLVRLDRIGIAELTELVTEAWYARAPKRLAATYRTAHDAR